MRTCFCTVHAVASLLMIGTMIPPAVAAAEDVCSDFDRRHTITRLGGPNALSPGGLETRAEIQAYFAANGGEIRAILASEGLGDEVADALLAAIREDEGIRERPMEKNEKLRWMAYRKDGVVRTIRDVCLDLEGTAPAFEISVPVLTATETVAADCTLEIDTECRPDHTGTFKVRSAPGATVTKAGPGGVATIIEGGATTWNGPIEDPYVANYLFAAANSAVPTETITTYTFLVPRECVNLALVDTVTQTRPGMPKTCSERRELTKPVCPVPPPKCDIAIDLAEVRRGESVTYSVTGDWHRLDLELRLDGAEFDGPALTESGGFTPVERGTYTILGTASNVIGDQASCRASVEAVGHDWITRGFGTVLFVDGGTTNAPVDLAKADCPCPPDAEFGYDDGFGLGVNLERLFTERFGIEGRLGFARLDSDFEIGANGLEISDSDSAGFMELSLALNVHILPDRMFDWYAGPFIGYGDLDGYTSRAYGRSLEYRTGGGTMWGAQTGLDWPLGSGPWFLHAGARFTRGSVDLTRRFISHEGLSSVRKSSVDIDPFTLEFGVAYQF